MRRLLPEDGGFVLSAIIDSSGSTPRGPGALMLTGRNGRLWGSIGGAQAEYRCLENAKTLIAGRGGVSLQKFVMADAAPQSDGRYETDETNCDAVCGGWILVFSQYLDSAAAGLPDLLEKGVECFSEKECTWLFMKIADNSSLCLAQAGGIRAYIGAQPVSAAALLTSAPACREQDGGGWFSMPLTRAGLVYIFGGGHVAQELAPLLSRLEFRCVVFDDRDEFTRRELFPDAVGIIRGDFSRIEDSLALDENDYALVVTRGHRWDFQVESFALNSKAAYIGVIGSKRKHAFIEEQLRAHGFSAEQIHASRVHAPVGINIGSKTPAEVAVSIAAELISVRFRQTS